MPTLVLANADLLRELLFTIKKKHGVKLTKVRYPCFCITGHTSSALSMSFSNCVASWLEWSFNTSGMNANTVKLRIEAGSRINAGSRIQAGVKVICTDRSWVSVTSRVPNTGHGKSCLAHCGNASNDDVILRSRL